MPAVSEKQKRFMCAAAAGKVEGATISREKAEEFCHTEGKLPEKLSDFGKKKEGLGSLKK